MQEAQLLSYNSSRLIYILLYAVDNKILKQLTNVNKEQIMHDRYDDENIEDT